MPISFSAGVDAQNYADCVALGFTPVTTCTDLLRPGGYGRLPRYDALLAERMRAVGAPRIGDFVVRAFGQGEEAVRAEVPEGPARDALLGRPRGAARASTTASSGVRPS